MTDHKIKDGSVELRSLLLEQEYKNAEASCKNKGLLFIEQTIEADQLRMMKWKHIVTNKLENKRK